MTRARRSNASRQTINKNTNKNDGHNSSSLEHSQKPKPYSSQNNIGLLPLLYFPTTTTKKDGLSLNLTSSTSLESYDSYSFEYNDEDQYHRSYTTTDTSNATAAAPPPPPPPPPPSSSLLSPSSSLSQRAAMKIKQRRSAGIKQQPHQRQRDQQQEQEQGVVVVVVHPTSSEGTTTTADQRRRRRQRSANLGGSGGIKSSSIPSSSTPSSSTPSSLSTPSRLSSKVLKYRSKKKMNTYGKGITTTTTTTTTLVANANAATITTTTSATNNIKSSNNSLLESRLGRYQKVKALARIRAEQKEIKQNTMRREQEIKLQRQQRDEEQSRIDEERRDRTSLARTRKEHNDNKKKMLERREEQKQEEEHRVYLEEWRGYQRQLRWRKVEEEQLRKQAAEDDCDGDGNTNVLPMVHFLAEKASSSTDDDDDDTTTEKEEEEDNSPIVLSSSGEEATSSLLPCLSPMVAMEQQSFVRITPVTEAAEWPWATAGEVSEDEEEDDEEDDGDDRYDEKLFLGGPHVPKPILRRFPTDRATERQHHALFDDTLVDEEVEECDCNDDDCYLQLQQFIGAKFEKDLEASRRRARMLVKARESIEKKKQGGGDEGSDACAVARAIVHTPSEVGF